MILLRPSDHFQRDVCIQCAYASSWAYLSERDIKTRMVATGADRCTVIADEATDTQLFVGGDSRSLIVAFRGTSSLRDWLTDLQCGKWPWVSHDATWHSVNGKAVLAHIGFIHALDKVWFQITEALTKYRTTNQYVTFTGHSLGGALAMLAAQSWSELGLAAGLYTFGQPRVWNSAGAAMFDRLAGKFAWRTVHAEDVVPRVPWLLGSYRHAGNELFFDCFDRPHINASTISKLPSDIYGLVREWKSGKVALLADHAMERYLDLVSRPTNTPANPDCELRIADCGLESGVAR